MVNRDSPALLACATVLLLAALFFAQQLSTGRNLQFDEFYALERSYGFAKHGDWLSVYSGNQITAKKPPLQYWLVAIALESGMPELLALRFWSYLFFLALLLAGGYFCYLLSGKNVWAGAACMLLLCSSTELVKQGRSGMLDAGMGFFILCSLLALYLARNRPSAWLFCGFAIGLGALQKAPVGLLFVTIMLCVMTLSGDDRHSWRLLKKDYQFRRGLALALLMIFSWPIVQTLRMGSKYFSIAVKREMLVRFSPISVKPGADDDYFQWLSWLAHDLGLFTFVAVLCVALVLFVKRWRNNRFLFAIAILILIIAAALSLATGKIYSRYLVVFSPLLIILSVIVISDLTRQWKPAVFGLSLLFFFFSFSAVKETLEEIDRRDTLTPAKEYIELIDRHRTENERVFIDASILPAGAYGIFGKSQLPFYYYHFRSTRDFRGFDRIVDDSEHGVALVGLTSLAHKNKVEESAGPLETIAIKGDVVVWRYRLPDG